MPWTSAVRRCRVDADDTGEAADVQPGTAAVVAPEEVRRLLGQPHRARRERAQTRLRGSHGSGVCRRTDDNHITNLATSRPSWQGPRWSPASRRGAVRLAAMTPAPRTERPYDIVLLGATGFAGRLTAEYLARTAPTGARWALAGRNADQPRRGARLAVDGGIDRRRAQRGRDRRGLAAPRGGAEQGAGHHRRPLRQLTATPLVAACAAAGTDYLDLTGEPEFVDTQLRPPPPHRAGHRRPARARRRLRLDPARPRRAVHRPAAARGRADRSVGVPARVRRVLRRHVPLRDHRVLPAPRRTARPPGERKAIELRPTDRSARAVPGRPHRDPVQHGWAVPLPTIDPQVIARSARALPRYGPDFRYSHYASIPTLPLAVGGALGVGALFGLAQIPPARRALLSRQSPGRRAVRGEARTQLVHRHLRRRPAAAGGW